MKTVKFVMTVLVGLLGVALLWWLRHPEDPAHEVVVDYDDDDEGIDVDDDENDET